MKKNKSEVLVVSGHEKADSSTQFEVEEADDETFLKRDILLDDSTSLHSTWIWQHTVAARYSRRSAPCVGY